MEKRGEMDNTIIAFTSDHGEMNGDWGLIYKMNFLDGALRVPLLFRTPETAANGGAGVSDAPVENCDLGPTLVELAGAELDHPQFGRSLAGMMNGAPPVREDAISEFRGEFMLADNDWKIALNREGQAYLLFHLAEDPHETRNLAGNPDYHDTESELRLRILERISTSQLKAP
ncbi:MAG: sulfatase-like hydrolase/transferase [Gammaproteobacteria bacterium]|nr:sulfatase-like hydrolase/transferase [Gammaproteobacteria bacterium]